MQVFCAQPLAPGGGTWLRVIPAHFTPLGTSAAVAGELVAVEGGQEFWPAALDRTVMNAISIITLALLVVCVAMGRVAWSRTSAQRAALADAERRHRVIMDSLQSPIVVVTKNGTVLEVNEAWRRAQQQVGVCAGVSEPGQNYFCAVSERSNSGTLLFEQVRTGLKGVMEGTISRRNIEFSQQDIGETRWFEQSIQWLSRPEFGILITLNEITMQRRAQRECPERQQELTHLARVAIVGQFSGAIAHEIRQPLTAILANAEAAALLLRNEPVDLAQLRQIVADIAADDLRAAEIIQRLRGMLRKAEPQWAPVQMNDLVTDSLLLARSNLAGRRIVVQASLQHQLPHVVADRIQMQQVILNLISNACDAMSGVADEQRRLTLTTRTALDHAEVELVVGDCGGGLQQQLGGRMFEPFVTTKPEGLGLGLSISKSIVVSHGGRLWAENAPSGAAFHVALPARLH